MGDVRVDYIYIIRSVSDYAHEHRCCAADRLPCMETKSAAKAKGSNYVEDYDIGFYGNIYYNAGHCALETHLQGQVFCDRITRLFPGSILICLSATKSCSRLLARKTEINA